MSATHGVAAEERARRVAALLGVAEFVYKPPVIRKGSGVREVGDGILRCGAGGAIIQVKARAREAGLADSEGKAKRWVQKNFAEAVSQGRGSKRTIEQLQRQGTPLVVSPMRAMILSGGYDTATRMSLDVDCSTWPTIVVLSHAQHPVVPLPYHDDVFHISLQDWQMLNRSLRSVNSLMRYVHLVLSHGSQATVSLGRERERFQSLATHHEAAQLHPMGVPEFSNAAWQDPAAVDTYRNLIEQTAGPNDDSSGFLASDYTEILDFLDDLPASAQARVGRVIMHWQSQLRLRRRRVSGLHLLNDRLLVYMCDLDANQPEKRSWLADLMALTTLRQTEWREQMRVDRPALGVGVRISDGGLEEYSYAIIREGSELTPDLRRFWEYRFGVSNFRTFENREARIGRNESCTCGSGKKFKRCHGAPSNRTR